MKPDSVENLGERLLALYGKTATAYLGKDYPQPLSAGLIAIYTYGVRQGRLITKALSDGQ